MRDFIIINILLEKHCSTHYEWASNPKYEYNSLTDWDTTEIYCQKDCSEHPTRRAQHNTFVKLENWTRQFLTPQWNSFVSSVMTAKTSIWYYWIFSGMLIYRHGILEFWRKIYILWLTLLVSLLQRQNYKLISKSH